ncbi:MAG: hypothetical protein ACRDSL_11950 [Pseudonocardiaceae bacterium]
MLSAASRGVHLLGWKSYDAGQQGLAALAEAEQAPVLMATDRGDEMPFWALAWVPPAASV